jgi:hypothetical protein
MWARAGWGKYRALTVRPGVLSKPSLRAYGTTAVYDGHEHGPKRLIALHPLAELDMLISSVALEKTVGHPISSS